MLDEETLFVPEVKVVFYADSTNYSPFSHPKTKQMNTTVQMA